MYDLRRFSKTLGFDLSSNLVSHLHGKHVTVKAIRFTFSVVSLSSCLLFKEIHASARSDAWFFDFCLFGNSAINFPQKDSGDNLIRRLLKRSSRSFASRVRLDVEKTTLTVRDPIGPEQ